MCQNHLPHVAFNLSKRIEPYPLFGEEQATDEKTHILITIFFLYLQSKNPSLAGQSFTGKNSLRPEPGPLFGGDYIFLNNN